MKRRSDRRIEMSDRCDLECPSEGEGDGMEAVLETSEFLSSQGQRGASVESERLNSSVR